MECFQHSSRIFASSSTAKSRVHHRGLPNRPQKDCLHPYCQKSDKRSTLRATEIRQNANVRFCKGIDRFRGICPGRSKANGDRVVVGCSGAESMSLDETMPDDEMEIWGWRKRSMQKILAFAIPALAIPLADPLLSVVDTVCVAQYAGTVELAALGPNTAIFNFVNYIFNSLGLATITIVADRLGKGNEEGASRALSTALFVALTGGVLSTIFLLTTGARLITAAGTAPAIVAPALSYLRVRALAQPAAISILVCQAALLAQKDSTTPLLTVGIACFINVIGDIFLIANAGWGVGGAALATLVAELIEVAIMLVVLQARGKVKPRLIVPPWEEFKKLMVTLGPLSIVYLCKNMCYVTLQWTAAGLEMMKLAAHQAMYAWWTLYAFCHAPVEHSALAFIPSAKSIRERVGLSVLILGFGMCVGLCGGFAASLIPYYFPHSFTPDARLWPLMKSIAPCGLLALIFCGTDVGATSILYANQDAGFIAGAMAWNLGITSVYFFLCRRLGWGLTGVWSGLVLFFVLRVLWSVPRVFGRHMGGDQPALSPG